MAEGKSNSNNLYGHLVANSLFTTRQLSIISKRLQGGGRTQDISSGAYYRQVGQCRDKVNAVLYSMILLQSTGIVQPEALSALSRLAEQGLSFPLQFVAYEGEQIACSDVFRLLGQDNHQRSLRFFQFALLVEDLGQFEAPARFLGILS